MRFDEIDARMRAFEAGMERQILPELHVVVRLDGRGFTRLTKERHDFARPFDPRFRDMMVETTLQLMQCGFRCVYGHTQSDEISLLLHRDDDAFGRRERKLLTLLAGEASARFSLLLGAPAVFDARLSTLPTDRHVIDYFRWRHEDAHRNALNAHCYWLYRGQGLSADEATRRLDGSPAQDKHELLFAHGINFNDLPGWQKRGSACYWREASRVGIDPRSGERRESSRRRLGVEMELPQGDDYSVFVARVLADDR